MKFNPFKPNGIALPGMFAGRGDELNSLEQALFQAKHGNPWHFLIHGERGIGKSSLLNYIDLMARGYLEGLRPDAKFRFVVATVELEPSTGPNGLVQKIARELANSLKAAEPNRAAVTHAWDFLKRWEVCGVKYADQSSAAVSTEDLCDTLAIADTRLKDEVDGFLILIDEADKGATSSDLGEFLKIATERLSKKQCNRVAFGLSGISDVLPLLRESHESSLRVLNALELKPLEDDESNWVVRRGLEESHRKSDSMVQITPEAEDWIVRYSEGYPHFIQQYAFSAFETDNDDVIDVRDVEYAVEKENGALDQLGVRYFEEMYLDRIQSDDYRLVLQVMAMHPDVWIERQKIKELTGIAESTLGNALTALKDRKLIVPQRGKRGVFRLPTDSFGAWIRARMLRASREKTEKRI